VTKSMILAVAVRVALPFVAVTAGAIYLSAKPQYGYNAYPTVSVPLYGVGLAPQQPATPGEGNSVEERLARMEAKLDKLLKLIEDELTPVDPPADPKAAASQPPAALISGASKCANCHMPTTAGDKGGGFALFTAAGTFANLNQRQLAQVRKRLATTDPSFQMPPPGSGTVLTDPERAALVSAFADPPKKEPNP
jgi:mono/diheme cytochrome c family protein